MRIKSAIEAKNVIGPVASAAQLKPNAINKLWGGPNPLSATIGGGLLGALGGFGTGWLAEQFLPRSRFERGRLRRAGLVAGGMAGAVPGLYWALDNLRADPNNKGSLGAFVSSYPWPEKEVQSSSRFSDVLERLKHELPAEAQELNELWVKYADMMSDTGGGLTARIPVDQFGRTIWNDLRQAGGYTPAPVAAATTGLLQAASLSQGGASFVTPVDIARIGVGMGSGWLSGMVVGKTLGALAGLRPQTQQTLQQAGVWAGVLNNVVPMAFGSK